jgi:hypothetical protein
MKSPRFIKTHLPWELLPKQIRDGIKKPKVCYLVKVAANHELLEKSISRSYRDVTWYAISYKYPRGLY